MIEFDNYSCLTINELLIDHNEVKLNELFNNFLCSKNLEIEKFLKFNSIEFNKRSQAISYIIFDNKQNLVAYFSLSLKPITIKSDIMSKKELKKVLRITELESDNYTVNPASYLIAQLGKADKTKIDIDIIFKFINYYINEAKNICGGVIEFLESENETKLIDLYKQRGFKIFNIRKSNSREERKLVQMYRLI